MALWLVRAGRRGEHEELALEEKVAVIGWDRLPSLGGVQSRDELAALVQRHYAEAKPNTLRNWVGQIWAFVREMKEGDWVALPLKRRAAIAFGRVAGPYKFRGDLPPEARHTRAVEWMREVPRNDIDLDLRYSLGAFMTVCRIRRNDAEQRIRALLEGRPSTGSMEDAEELGESGETNLEELAVDQIRRFVETQFQGHRLADLVAAVLQAQGYRVRVSPPGPDGGVDILAGKGPLGLDGPRIAVQVKSSRDPVDIRPVRELQGAMGDFSADRGLFVAWGGFRQSVEREAGRLFFQIRLWDSDALLRELMQVYDGLPEDIQAQLPLKRIWVLVPPSEDVT